MGLAAVLVDRARPIRPRRDVHKVEGSTQMVPDEGAWFRCRLNVATGEEREGGTGRRTVPGTSIICALKDENGQAVELSINDRVEVESRELGLAVWQVTADPRPIRKKRSLLGLRVQLKRVDEHPGPAAV